jgi:hypothetical protein
MFEDYGYREYQNVVVGSLVCVYVPDDMFSFAGAGNVTNATFVGSFSYGERYCCNFYVCGSGSSFINYGGSPKEEEIPGL